MPEPIAPAESSSPPRPHLKALTGIRFFAALHVVAYHVIRPHSQSYPQWVQNFVGNGYTGVALFFVLSGFILSYTYAVDRNATGVELRKFWMARFARIYPVYALGLVFDLPWFLNNLLSFPNVNLGMSVLRIPADIFLIQSLFPVTVVEWNPQGWSLSVEAAFYLVLPLCIPWLLRLKRPALLAGVMLSLILAWVPVIVFQMVYPNGIAGTNAAPSWAVWAVQANPLVCMPTFFAGAFAGRLFLMSEGQKRATVYGAVSEVLLVAAVLAVYAGCDSLTMRALNIPILIPLYLGLIWLLARGRGPISQLLSLSFLLLLGEASYALYIIHGSMANLLGRLWWHFTKGQPDNPAYYAFHAIVSIGLSIAIFKYFEAPLREKIRSRAGKPRRPAEFGTS